MFESAGNVHVVPAVPPEGGSDNGDAALDSNSALDNSSDSFPSSYSTIPSSSERNLHAEDYVLHQPLHSDEDHLHKGDVIVVVHHDLWKKARLPSNSSLQDLRNESLYWNYIDIDGTNPRVPRGSYLLKGQSLGVLHGVDVNLDLSLVNLVVPGGGGNLFPS